MQSSTRLHQRFVFLVFVVIIGTRIDLFSQQNIADSLLQVLRASENKGAKDLEHHKLLNQVARSIYMRTPDSASALAKRALWAALTNKDTVEIAFSHNILGLVYLDQTLYEQSLQELLQALRLFENIHDTLSLARIYNNLGNLYGRQNQFEKALDFYTKAALLYSLKNAQKESIGANTNVGFTYWKQGKFKEALAKHQQSLEMARRFAVPFSEAIAQLNIGATYLSLKQYDSARAYLLRALTLVQGQNNKRMVMVSRFYEAQVDYEQRQYIPALEKVHTSLDLAKALKARDEELKSLTLLAQIFTAQKNSDSALHYYVRSAELKDSLFTLENTKALAALQSLYSTEKKDSEIRFLQEEQRTQNIIRNALIGSIVVVVILLGIAFARYYEKKGITQQLMQKQEDLEHQAQEIQTKNSQLEQSYYTAQILSEIGRDIASSLNIEKVFATLYDRVNMLMEADSFVIGLGNESRQTLVYQYAIEEGVRMPQIEVSLKDTMRLSVQCYLHQQEFLNNDRITTAVIGKSPKSVLFVPLLVEDRCIGFLSAQSFVREAYLPHHITLLRSIAAFAATALDNATAYSRIATQQEMLEQQAQEIQITNTALQEQLETLRRTQTQLAQAEKMASLGTLVAGVAHELNTPIGVAVTAASTLDVRTKDFVKRYQEGGLKKSELDAYVQTAQMGADLTLRNLERAANLIQSFKQVAVDQTTDNKRRIGVKSYIAGIITSLEPKWKTTRHRVELVCDETLEMETYPGAIAQIITNLIDNSLLHGFQGYTEEGIMRITVEHQAPSNQAPSNQVNITYSDNGRGIPQEVLPRIFDPFFTTKQAQGGTGLGMHIVYNLVTQKLGGRIWCENTKADQGTKFLLTLPLTISM